VLLAGCLLMDDEAHARARWRHYYRTHRATRIADVCARRQAKIDRGQCVDCSAEALPGRRRCLMHQERLRIKMRTLQRAAAARRTDRSARHADAIKHCSICHEVGHNRRSCAASPAAQR
jgi:hypothetical protein